MLKFNSLFQPLYEVRNEVENRGRYAHIVGLLLSFLTSVISDLYESYHKEIWLIGMFLSGIIILYGWVLIIKSKTTNGTLNDIKRLLPYLKIGGLVVFSLYLVALFRFLM
jgi:hypothetical protein